MTITFRSGVSIQDAMRFEECLPEPLRLYSQERKVQLLASGLASYVFVDGELAGEAYGASTSTSSDPDVSMFQGGDDVCLYGCAILDSYRGYRLSKLLVAHWLGGMTELGAHLVVGHAVHPAMKATLRLLGAEFTLARDNWGGSGLTAHFFKLPIE